MPSLPEPFHTAVDFLVISKYFLFSGSFALANFIPMNTVYTACYKSPIGTVKITADEHSVTGLIFTDDEDMGEMEDGVADETMEEPVGPLLQMAEPEAETAEAEGAAAAGVEEAASAGDVRQPRTMLIVGLSAAIDQLVSMQQNPLPWALSGCGAQSAPPGGFYGAETSFFVVVFLGVGAPGRLLGCLPGPP